MSSSRRVSNFMARDTAAQNDLTLPAEFDVGYGELYNPKYGAAPDSFLTGRYIDSNIKEDEKMASFLGYSAPGVVKNISFDFDKYEAWKNEKRAKQKYMNFLALATTLIDVKNRLNLFILSFYIGKSLKGKQ